MIQRGSLRPVRSDQLSDAVVFSGNNYFTQMSKTSLSLYVNECLKTGIPTSISERQREGNVPITQIVVRN